MKIVYFAKKLIDYNPQFPLDEGYVDYINWYKEFYAQFSAS